jgi:hypothetical protein
MEHLRAGSTRFERPIIDAASRLRPRSGGT